MESRRCSVAAGDIPRDQKKVTKQKERYNRSKTKQTTRMKEWA
jgi:hypothetical protein